MKIEDQVDFIEAGNPLKNKHMIKINIFIIIIGAFIIGLSYAGKLLPLNKIISEGEQHYAQVDRHIDSVWESESELILVYGHNPGTYDSYNRETEVITYSIDFDYLFDSEEFVNYGFGLNDSGFSKLSILSYNILGWVRIVGILVLIAGIFKLFINPRKNYNVNDMSIVEAKATRLARDLTKTCRR